MRATNILSLALVAGLAMAACTGQTGEQTDSEEMGMEDVQETQLVEDFRADARVRLDEIDGKIQALQAEADSATGEMQAELQTKIQDFQSRSELLEQHIRELAWETAEYWEQSKQQINTALDGLRQDVDGALMPAETAPEPAPEG
jgi:peptidoglycan hydrolase CwlO-like protein